MSMSDLDDDFMQMSEDEEDFSFEYEEDDELMDDDEINIDDDTNNKNNILGSTNTTTSTNDSVDVDPEYLYYTAKAMKEEDIGSSIEQFKLIISHLDYNSNNEIQLEFIFKSIKQTMKLYYHINEFDQLMQILPTFFQVLGKLSNKQYGEESINRLVSHYDKPKSTLEFLTKFLDLIITGVIETYKQENLSHSRLIPQDRLWLKLNLIKANLLIRNGAKKLALNLLSSLQEICENSSENIKGSYMLEIIALQIQMYSAYPETSNILKELYDKSFQINSAVPHPRIMGIIKECGGEIYMRQSNYKKASNEFYESFKNYDELGDNKRISMLKRLMISNMLSENEINPFHSKEFQSFVKLDEIQIFLNLYDSFIDNDIKRFNSLIEQNSNQEGYIFDDEFLTTYIEELKTMIQIKTIIQLTKYHNRLELSFLSDFLHCDIKTVQLHILKLINSGKLVNLKIDYVDNIVEIMDVDRDLKILGNIDANDIIQNLQETTKLVQQPVITTTTTTTTKATDVDGDHLMDDHLDPHQPQESPPTTTTTTTTAKTSAPLQQQHHHQQQVTEISQAVNDRADYTQLSCNIIQSLNLILGNFHDMVTKEDEQSKSSSMYTPTLQNILRDWLKILQKSIPVKVREKLSQIEQVKLEQQQQQQQQIQDIDINNGNNSSGNNNNVNNDDSSASNDTRIANEVEQETLMGELSLDVVGSGANNEDNTEDLTIEMQTDGLRRLIKSINLYQHRLMIHYEEKAKFTDIMLERFKE